jgi:hypothetical protein
MQPGQELRIDGGAKGASMPSIPRIKADRTSGNAPLTVTFSADRSLTEGSYFWDMGNWNFAFTSSPVFTYREPGMYTVRLRVYGQNGGQVGSSVVSVRVHPGSRPQNAYVTLPYPNGTLDVTKWLPDGMVHAEQSPALFEQIDSKTLKATRGGFSKILLQDQHRSQALFTFVSPYPSVQSYEPYYNWYKTQFGTGILGNCGPAVVAMASYWASGIDTSVATIRSEIGLPYANGAINFENMLPSLRKRNVDYIFRQVRSAADIRAVVDRGNIGIILIHTGRIGKNQSGGLTGRYYSDSTGHYVILKGYTLDGRYFIVYDPIPSDWNTNSRRYEDGVSMLGRNRFYSVDQVMRALRRARVMEINAQ